MANIARRLESARGILFDLDNTLYPRERGVFDHINRRISDFVRFATGRTGREAERIRKEYVRAYGTTLAGLMRHEEVEPDEYLTFVHDVPVEELLEPDAALDGFLAAIDLPMVIFTNGTSGHAQRVMEALGISGYFEAVCDLTSTAYRGKPHREAFDAAVSHLPCGLDSTIFIDDLPENVLAGAAAGALAIHVDGRGPTVGDLGVGCVKELGPVFSPMPWYRERKAAGV